MGFGVQDFNAEGKPYRRKVSSYGQKQLIENVNAANKAATIPSEEEKLKAQLAEEEERLMYSDKASAFDLEEFRKNAGGLVRSVKMSAEDDKALSTPFEDFQREVDAEYNKSRDSTNLQERIGLRKRLTDAMNLSVEEGREERVAELKDIGINELGIDQQAMSREVLEERSRLGREFGEKVKARQEKRKFNNKRDYDDFFARANDPNRTLGSGSRRSLYSRNDGLRKARKLRRMGFVKAAEQAASDWQRSAAADAPAISTPAMRAQQEQDSARVAEVRESNRRLQQLLINRGIKQVDGDPDFKPFT